MEKNRIKGASIVLICAFLWAINGNIGAYLFQTSPLTPSSLTAIRLLCSGCCLLLYMWWKNRPYFSFYRDRKVMGFIFLYGFLGLLLMQYAYFTAMSYSNAPTATLIQYLGGFLVVFILAIFMKKKLPWETYPALGLSFLGVFLLVTGGEKTALHLSRSVFFYGGLSMIGYAIYNVAPLPIGKKVPSIAIAGGGMFCAGLFFMITQGKGILHEPWTPFMVFGTLYTIILGTLLPFVLYMEGQKLVGPENAPIFALLESVFSAGMSYFWFGIRFNLFQLLGMALILGMSFWLAFQEKSSAIP